MLACLSGSDHSFFPHNYFPSSVPLHLFSQLPFPRLPLGAPASAAQPEPQPQPPALDKTFQQWFSTLQNLRDAGRARPKHQKQYSNNLPFNPQPPPPGEYDSLGLGLDRRWAIIFLPHLHPLGRWFLRCTWGSWCLQALASSQPPPSLGMSYYQNNGEIYCVFTFSIPKRSFKHSILVAGSSDFLCWPWITPYNEWAEIALRLPEGWTGVSSQS